MMTFLLLAAVLICSAVFVVSARKPVHAVVGLLANFTALAATYLTLSAEFLAIAQILVYTGAILILFLFVIALLSSGIEALDLGEDRLSKIPAPALLSFAVALAAIVSAAARSGLGPALKQGEVTTDGAGVSGAFGSVAEFGAALFTQHLLPFELTALVLLIAIIGVVMITGEREGLALPPKPRRRRLAEQPREPILPRGGH